MGWFRDVVKSLSNNEVIEATEEDLSEISRKTDIARIKELEENLENKENLVKRLKPKKANSVKQNTSGENRKTKQPTREEERE